MRGVGAHVDRRVVRRACPCSGVVPWRVGGLLEWRFVPSMNVVSESECVRASEYRDAERGGVEKNTIA